MEARTLLKATDVPGDLTGWLDAAFPENLGEGGEGDKLRETREETRAFFAEAWKMRF